MSSDQPLLLEIQKGESKTLEFKQQLPKGQQIAKTLIAFANGSGGKFIVGVTDDRQLVGIQDDIFDKQLWLISRHKEFISTYSSLARGDAGKNWTAYSDFIVSEIKKDASKFSKKRPIREYLDGNEEDYDFSR